MTTPDCDNVAINETLVELLRTELSELADSLADELAPLLDPDSAHETWKPALETYNAKLQQLAEAADTIGLTGLAQVYQQLSLNQNTWAVHTQPITGEQQALLLGWPTLTLDYLYTPTDTQLCSALVLYLQDRNWPRPLAEADASALLTQLSNIRLSAEPTPGPQRQQQAQPEDVSLVLPEFAQPELLDSMLQELPAQTGEFSRLIQRLVAGTGSLQDLNQAQRLAHTLKGAANTVGIAGIANLTHHTEDILLALTEQGVLPSTALADALSQVADCLEAMSEKLLGVGPAPDDAQHIMQTVLDWANQIDQHGLPDDAEPASQPSPTPFAINQADDPSPTTAISESGPAPLRVPSTLIDNVLRLVGESMILSTQLQEHRTLQHEQSKATQDHDQRLQDFALRLEQFSDTAREHSYSHELQTLSRQLQELAKDGHAMRAQAHAHQSDLETLLISQQRLLSELQEAVLRTRMIAVQTVIPRLQRSVRQTCRLADKSVELNISGAETLIDNTVLNQVLDPLMHILRNAIDHGIEDPATRQTLGKPAQGHIELSFSRESNTIAIRCRDDGRGLDYDAIRRTAETRGLLAPQQAADEQDLIQFILQPGFSTRTAASQVSGRGIGLDAVYNQLLAIKGSLQIESSSDQGCLIELRLPVNLIATHALLIRAQQQLYAVADRGIEQVIHLSSGKLLHSTSGREFELDAERYPVIELERLLNLPAERRKTERHSRPLLLVRDDTGHCQAIMVEAIVDNRGVVVKNLGDYVPQLPGILGAAILGDGSVAPVLDMPELLRAPPALMPSMRILPATKAEPPIYKDSEAPQILIVDDSLSMRRSLEQLLGDIGFVVRTASNGLEAIELLSKSQPDAIITDLEMPRMNGLDLTAHVRARPATAQLPVLMLTSRSTAQHRQRATQAGVSAYLNKPVVEDELIYQLQKFMDT